MGATLECELGQGDLEAFLSHHAAHAPYIVARNRRMRWMWGGFFAFSSLGYVVKPSIGGVAFAIAAAIGAIFYGRLNRWWYVRHNLRLNAGADAPRFGRTRLELADRHLLIDAPEESSKLHLSAIRRIDESDTHYFIYLGPAAAGILPKAVSQADGFVRALRAAMAA